MLGSKESLGQNWSLHAYSEVQEGRPGSNQQPQDRHYQPKYASSSSPNFEHIGHPDKPIKPKEIYNRYHDFDHNGKRLQVYIQS